MRVCVVSTVVPGLAGEQLECEFRQHPLHPDAEFSAGAADAAGLLLQSHGLSGRGVLGVCRIPLKHTHTHHKHASHTRAHTSHQSVRGENVRNL